MSSQEKRQINAFGPNCFIETGSNDMGNAGNTAMALCSKNDSGHQFNMSQHGSGLSRIHSDGTLEIAAGQVENAVQSNDGQAIMIETEHGKVDIVVKNNSVNIKATNITIDAEDTLVLQGNNVRIGRSEKNTSTSNVDIHGNRVHIHNPKDGNMAIVLRTHSMFSSFAGSYVSAGKIAAKYFGGVGF